MKERKKRDLIKNIHNTIAKCIITIKNMSKQLQSTSTIPSVSLEKTELLTAIKDEPPESEIGIDDIPSSLAEQIIPDLKYIDIVSHVLSEHLIKSETVSENTFVNNHSGSLETQVFVKTENIPLIKTENITQHEYLYKTQDTSDGNVSRGTSQGVIEVQGSNEHFNALQSDEQFVNFFKDLSDSKVKCLNETDFSECYKTVGTTSCEKDRKKGMVIEVPVIPYSCEKCLFITENHSCFKRHKLSHKTKAEVDGRCLKYLCDKCKYKTCWLSSFKRHKLIHLKPKQIPYLYCYHCSYKSNHKANLQRHILRHFKNKDVPFHCYICDFVTLKRDLFFEHFKTHPKHHTKCDEIDFVDGRYLKYICDKCKYKTCWLSSFKRHKLIHLKPKQIPYLYCYHCSYKSNHKANLQRHILHHFKNKDVPFHCYICDFVTLKRDLIIEHFKTHPKHHSKCDEIDYEKQLQTYTKKQTRHYSSNKCSYRTYCYERLKLHELTHETEAKMDDRHLKYRCEKCKYKTFRHHAFKTHKLIHLKQEEICYFHCYHCSHKCKRKSDLKIHIFRHFKNENIPFHCYICDFVTLKRVLIIDHLKMHPKHHSIFDETEYKYQPETCNKRYNYCKKCLFKTYHYESLILHELTCKAEAKMDGRHFKYRCNKCKYKTFRNQNLKRHKLIHLKPEEIQYFYCYHCSYKSNRKHTLKDHIFRHFNNEEIPFNCYICDFVTLKRESFKKHLKHHNKCQEN